MKIRSGLVSNSSSSSFVLSGELSTQEITKEILSHISWLYGEERKNQVFEECIYYINQVQEVRCRHCGAKNPPE